ncbi:hypothetical protein ACFOD6_06860, partial [Tabrizicola soli]
MTELNCICLKYGTAYGPEYVNRLHAALLRNTTKDLRLFCMTDDPAGIDPRVELLDLPNEPFAERMDRAMRSAPKQGRLKKISLFRPGLIPDLTGPLLVLGSRLIEFQSQNMTVAARAIAEKKVSG